MFLKPFGPLLDFIMKFSDNNNNVLFFDCERNIHNLFQTLIDKSLVTQLTFMINFIQLLIYVYRIHFILALLPNLTEYLSLFLRLSHTLTITYLLKLKYQILCVLLIRCVFCSTV